MSGDGDVQGVGVDTLSVLGFVNSSGYAWLVIGLLGEGFESE